MYLESSSKVMADREKKGNKEIQRFEYLENEMSFHGVSRAIFWLRT